MPQPLSEAELSAALAELPGWESDGDAITRTYRLGAHLRAAAMALHVATIQDELDHHARLEIGYDTLAVTVNTHSAGGRVTRLDTRLARRIEEIAAGHGAR
ncbi:4a-hydroxytetrahydrobiopterin dehydratase [Streptomyces sp. TRM 70351]|uniref:4a-hydroxytetrahydrobiopterin dehydratase n=1 Tax=Streptomyces sp. TRM 70351 TaxID=3116552 RepID=UPI002E7B5AA0|nr:4a-hydroxytetrahydrobiopterin dehydratase [Streptomyces sp. TRM 70351]MEE1926943.1 4a-hydroxytetrahydrobiopterin dehydratase [Streptomyces sp. TRM 70351]